MLKHAHKSASMSHLPLVFLDFVPFFGPFTIWRHHMVSEFFQVRQGLFCQLDTCPGSGSLTILSFCSQHKVRHLKRGVQKNKTLSQKRFGNLWCLFFFFFFAGRDALKLHSQSLEYILFSCLRIEYQDEFSISLFRNQDFCYFSPRSFNSIIHIKYVYQTCISAKIPLSRVMHTASWKMLDCNKKGVQCLP